ncbi:MAG: hypothetical protein A2X36_06805 [Elusimicrobia bacterium GWA2_69_24]|nr:MAG: hypothetical protein A2X36_06805 [Elusimicrobia bacterium GWA2_69_24]
MTILSILALPVLAQDLPKEVTRPGDALKNADSAARAAEAARQRSLESGADITYERILENPDDIELNYRYAQSQVRKGDLRGAAATLERILMVDPALPKVRLFYAVVLYRLDSLPEARKELLALKGQRMPESLRSEIEDYLARIDRRTKRTLLSALLGIGYEYDVNRNAAPASNSRLFGGNEVTLASGRRVADHSAMFLAKLGAERDLGLQAGHTLNTDFTYYRSEQSIVDNLDLQAYSLSLGGVYKHRLGNLSPTLFVDHVRLAQETYLRTRGLGLRYDRPITSRLSAFAELKNGFQDFLNTSIVPTGRDRRGAYWDLGYGGAYVLNPTHRLSLSMGHERKDSEADFQDYYRHRWDLSHAWLLGQGRFLLSSVNYNWDRYDAADQSVCSVKRVDHAYRLSGTFGTPLGFIYKPLKDLLWTFTYEYLKSRSNIVNYAYSNNRISTMLTYQWGGAF